MRWRKIPSKKGLPQYIDVSREQTPHHTYSEAVQSIAAWEKGVLKSADPDYRLGHTS